MNNIVIKLALFINGDVLPNLIIIFSKLFTSTKGYPYPESSIISNLNEIIPSKATPEKPTNNQDIETKAVDLLLGNNKEDYENILRRFEVSSDEESNNISELSDPLHDSSLLSDLFYTTKAKPEKAEESSLFFTEDDDTTLIDSSDKNKDDTERDETIDSTLPDTEHLEGADLASTKIESEESINSQYNYKKLIPDKLSVEILTILGRVKSAKVILRSISVEENQPLGTVYFAEYKFPVSNFGEEVCVAAETVCNVSKSISNRYEIQFERISVFPLHFNEEMVNYWWNQHVVVTVFVKFNRNQKKLFYGEARWRLRDVLLSNNLANLFTCDVYNDKKEPIGKIRVSILKSPIFIFIFYLFYSQFLFGSSQFLLHSCQFTIFFTRIQSNICIKMIAPIA